MLVMIIGIAGFAALSPVGPSIGGSTEYNGYEFNIGIRDGVQLYFTEVDGQEIGFYNNPFTVERLNVSETFNQELRGAEEITVTRPTDVPEEVELGLFQILLRDFQNFASVTVANAYLEEDPFDDTPVRTCEDATAQTPVIKLIYDTDDLARETGIYQESEYCYETHAFGQDIVILRDYLIMAQRGIIQ